MSSITFEATCGQAGFDPYKLLSQHVDEVHARYGLSSSEDTIDRLYHYTNLSGLLGILTPSEGKETLLVKQDTQGYNFVDKQASLGNYHIRATNYHFLNDWTESSYINQILQEVFDNGQFVRRDYELVDSLRLELSSSLSEPYRLSGLTPVGIADSFVACFCGKRDVLSQWRGYGNTGEGYCIEFAREYDEPIMSLPEGEAGVSMRRIIYNKPKQLAIISDLLDACVLSLKEVVQFGEIVLAKKRAIGANGFHRYEDYMFSYRNHMIAILVKSARDFKHPSFEEEEEIRLIKTEGFQGDKMKFSRKNETLVPYIDVPLSLTRPGQKGAFKLAGIQFGPGLNQSLTDKSLRRWLATTNFRDVEISRSRVPFSANFASRPTTSHSM